MTPQQFVNTLKESPYNDNLIDMWMHTFKDDSNTKPYLQAIEVNNETWEKFKKEGEKIDTFVNASVKFLKEEHGLPMVWIIPIMICCCDEICDTFLAQEFYKTITHINFG